MWTGVQLDNAVMVWGRFVENRLRELDEQRRPKYTLEQLLDLEPDLPPIPDEEIPEWGAPIPESLRKRASRNLMNHAEKRFLHLLSKEA